MANKIKISLKYKFLAVLMFTLAVGFSTFFTLAYRTFSEDKKLFVMELNLSILKTAVSDTRADLKSRIDELQIFLPKIYESNTTVSSQIFRDLSLQYLTSELIGVRFYRKNPTDGSLSLIKEFKNTDVLQNKSLPGSITQDIDTKTPLQLEKFSFSEGTKLINRSLQAQSSSGPIELSLLTLLVPGNLVNDNTKTVVIVVDILQDFLRKKLQQSELAEVFLITKDGYLISHSSPKTLIESSGTPFDHPIVERLKARQLPKESLELKIDKERYLCNLSETAIPDTYAISQIKESEAFLALKTLMRETLLTGVFILSIALILSIVFSNTLTSNIKKLKLAAQAVGQGDLEVQLDIKSNDEIQNVAESFRWMTSRIKQLIVETITKERMTKELETAKLIQSTLLTSNHVNTTAAEVEPFYLSASECGGDIWDAYQTGSTITVLVGDATGHGAAAAIVTAVAKSCFITLNSIYSSKPLLPDQFLTELNRVLFDSCKGQLLMTMAVVQMDLSSGETIISNAGHEAPLLLKTMNDPNSKNKCEPLFVRGERLGFSPESQFENLKVQLDVGDTILIYTDGVSEATNTENKQFGERAVKKLFNKLGTLPLAEIKTQLFEELKTFMGSEPQHDDITYVLLKWHHQLEKVIPTPAPIIAPAAVETISLPETETKTELPAVNAPNLLPMVIAEMETPLPKPNIETEPPPPAATLYNEEPQSVILLPPIPVNEPEQQKPVKDLITLAKESSFADEEVDTHYTRIEDSFGNNNDPSEGEAA